MDMVPQVAIAVLGGAAAVAAVPILLGAAGFTTTGIAASSLAAKMMSISAIASGGGVPAGGLVATLQSVGAAGLSLSSNVIVGATGSAVATTVAHMVGVSPCREEAPEAEAVEQDCLTPEVHAALGDNPSALSSQGE